MEHMSEQARSGKAQTVLGLIDPDDLGVTLLHEHLLLDQGCYFAVPDEASEREWIDAPFEMKRLGGLTRRFGHFRANSHILDESTAIQEVSRYKNDGGASLVDVTNVGIGRDPLALARISRATGLNIVMGAGYYVHPAHPPDMDDRSEESIAEEIVRDVAEGVGDTGIRSGIIGEIGNMWPTNDNERKSLRASAAAQRETGAAILVHPGFHPDSPPAIIDVLERAGADLRRVIIGHLGFFHDLGGLKAIAEAGCYLEWDTLGREDTSSEKPLLSAPMYLSSDEPQLRQIEALIEAGFQDRLIVSHDVCFQFQHARNGGRGYAHILESIVPRLRRRGYDEELINTIIADNPKGVLTFE